MINQTSLDAVQASRLNEQFGKPLYDSYCFSQLPQTVYHLLTGNLTDEGAMGLPLDTLAGIPTHYDKVILLFIDAFGWRFFDQHQSAYPFLRRFMDQGVVSKLTSQFPSTTAAHTTTIHTGLKVGESGVFEWFYYEPLLDRIIAPLLFSFAGEHKRNGLQKTKINAEQLFPTQTVYQRLAQQGVISYAFQHRDYTPSPFTDVMLTGARVSSYRTISEGLVNLADAVLAEKEKAYFYMYIDSIDAMGHLYGPGSRQFEAEIDTFMTMIEKLLHQRLAGHASNTLLLVTADHGQTEVSPQTVIYLNQLTPSIVPFIKSNRNGIPLIPAGSPRDMFLYIQDEKRAEAIDLLKGQLDGHAEVYAIETLIDEGMFGPVVSDTFRARVGNVVVLPYAHETVWWYEKGRFEQRNLGSHGGLSRDEMETPLLALPYQ